MKPRGRYIIRLGFLGLFCFSMLAQAKAEIVYSRACLEALAKKGYTTVDQILNFQDKHNLDQTDERVEGVFPEETSNESDDALQLKLLCPKSGGGGTPGG